MKASRLHGARATAVLTIIVSAPDALGATPPQPTVPPDAWFSLQANGVDWGHEVACSGDYLVTGAGPAKIAQVYRRTADGWQLWQDLEIIGSTGGATSPRMSGDTLALLDGSASDRFLRIFRLVEGRFVHEQSFADPPGESWISIDLDGDRVAVASKTGGVKVHLFTRSAEGVWIDDGLSTIASLPGSSALLIRLKGDRVAVSRTNTSVDGSTGAGTVFLAQRDRATGLFAPIQTIVPPNPQPLLGFGSGLGLSEDELLVGAPNFTDGQGSKRGIVYRYRPDDAGVWAPAGTIDSPETRSFEGFGSSLWTDGTRLVVGTLPDTPALSVPRAWTFVRSKSDEWIRGAAVFPLALPIGFRTEWRSLDSDGAMIVVGDRILPNESGSPGPRNLIVIDRLFDCDEDGIDDALEIHEGEADCDGNRRPDSCDAGTGQIDVECAADCNGDGVPDWLELSAGLESDCDQNGIPDTCDVAAGRHADLNGDGVPDACQPDCDGDGLVDLDSLLAETALDCDGDGWPNDCPRYVSGAPALHTRPWGYDYSPVTFVSVMQRFEIRPGAEVLRRLEFIVVNAYFGGEQSYSPVRVSLFRELGDGSPPLKGDLLWSEDVHAGPAGSWSSVTLPRLRVGENGDRFLVVLTRAQTQPNRAWFGGGYYCNVEPSLGCGESFIAWTSDPGAMPTDGMLDLAELSPTAWSLRLWTATCSLGDLDGDGVIGPLDLGILLGEWGMNPWSIADLNDDHLVNADDLALLLASWSASQ